MGNSSGVIQTPFGTRTTFGDGNEIIFDIPNMSAILLESSNKFFIDSNADEYFTFKNFPRINKSRTVWDYDWFTNLLQCRIWNVLCAFLALESFMNDSISEDYTFDNSNEIFKTRKWSPKILDKEFIMKDVTTKSKFEFILPNIYGKSPINIIILDTFVDIRNLRDRLTHLRPSDKKSCNSSEDTIWKALLAKDFQNYAIVVKEIIAYFFSEIQEDKIPRWFKKIPF